MNNEPNNEFDDGPTGEAAEDSPQSPSAPEHSEIEMADDTPPDLSDPAVGTAETDFEAYRPVDGTEGHQDPDPATRIAPPTEVGDRRRLVRDPHSRLGGVASGVAHYYGVDVSLVRLLFIAFVLFAGIGVLLYFLAWLIVPRAEYWPPVPPKGGTRAGLDNRQIALGLVAIGVLIAAFAAGGSGTQVVVALAMIGAGVWLFVQNPQAEVLPAPVGGPGPEDEEGHFTSGFSSGTVPPGPVPGGSMSSGYPTPQPVPRRRRRIWPLIVFPLLVVIPALVIASIIAFAVVIDDEAGFDDRGFTMGGDVVDDENLMITATSVDDLLDPIEQNLGTITLDLTELSGDDFADYETPVEVTIDGDLGEIFVVLPEDLDARVQADVDVGEINVLGRSADGLSASLSVGEGEPLVSFDIDLDFGAIDVRRVTE